jgi:FkbM family methyltransferase
VTLNQLLLSYLRAREHPGKLRIVRWLGRHVIPTAGLPAPVAHSLCFRLHPRDWIEYLLLRGVPYEEGTLRLIATNLLPGDGAILAGTSFGLHVAVAAQAIGPDGLVIGVEPQPAAIAKTRSNLEMNGLAPRVRLISAALGRSERLAEMAWSSPDHASAASLLDAGEKFSTSLVRLQSIRPLLGGRRFRLLLLDVQGYELEALGGLDLASGPECIVVEVDAEFLSRAGTRAEDIAGELLRAGYALFDIAGERDPDLLTLRERNLVALKPGVSLCWSRG